MRKFARVSAVTMSLAACNGASTVAVANNTLATLAKNDIPAACAIVQVAEGYYAQVVSTPNQAVTTAEAAVSAICARPPTDLAAAFATLLNEWTIIQSATVKP